MTILEIIPRLLGGNERLRLGLVRRSWGQTDTYLVYTQSGYFQIRKSGGTRTINWYPTADELLATDWEVYEAIPTDLPAKREG